jgi:hypothetical protein
MRMILVGIGCAIGVAGFFAGRSLAPGAIVKVVSQPSAERSAAVPTCAGTQLSNDDIARVRDSVLAALPPGKVSEPPAAQEPSPEPWTPEQQAAASEATRILEVAVAAGRWTDGDAQSFRSTLVEAPPGEQFELRRRVAAALNSGQLHLSATGPVL